MKVKQLNDGGNWQQLSIFWMYTVSQKRARFN